MLDTVCQRFKPKAIALLTNDGIAEIVEYAFANGLEHTTLFDLICDEQRKR